MKQITYFFDDSLNLGNILLALNELGEVVFVSLDNSKEDNIFNLKKEYPDVHVSEGVNNDNIKHIFAYIKNPVTNERFNVNLDGTDLQKQVWSELLSVKSGETVTYAELAKRIGKPTAVRAVATACGKNKIAVIIPCHRVVSKTGKDSGYRWGILRKKDLLLVEKEKSVW